MGKRQKAGGTRLFEAGLRSLQAWFERHGRVLPWREDRALYRVWVSEIMLQQTQVATVIPFFERFISRFPSVEALASASEEDVLLAWAGLGYYSRARNLHRGARAIVEAGAFPCTREGWLAIPGVGEYTAGAILSIALDHPEAILDGNVERVLSRVRRVSRGEGDATYKARLWRLSWAFVLRGHALGIVPSTLNQALMELGATVCTPRRPLCAFCPLAELCRARAQGEQEAYPPRKPPKEWVQVREEVHCLMDEGGHVLVSQRGGSEWRAGLWDLPKEAPKHLGLVGLGKAGKARAPQGFKRLGWVETRHVVTRHKITRRTHVWQATPSRVWTAAEAEAGACTGACELRWISIDDPGVAVGSALKRTLEAVRERFEPSPARVGRG